MTEDEIEHIRTERPAAAAGPLAARRGAGGRGPRWVLPYRPAVDGGHTGIGSFLGYSSGRVLTWECDRPPSGRPARRLPVPPCGRTALVSPARPYMKG